MSRSNSSSRWLKEHVNDPYVQKAQAQGYRSRAVYKLIEIQAKYHLCKKGMTVVDLGAAPGGWSQVMTDWVGPLGRVIAVDILPMDAIDSVIFIQGDFREASILMQIKEVIANDRVDLVVSDMAPNMSGNKAVDQPRMIYLAELAFDFAHQALKPNGSFLVKVFQGESFESYLKMLKTNFKQVLIRKPDASRDRSAEVYLVCMGIKKSIKRDSQL